MAKKGKRNQQLAEQVDRQKAYDIEDALGVLKQTAAANFDETVEAAFRLGIDTRKNDQQIRGAVVLPHGTGKTQRVLVIAGPDKAEEAKDAGADYAGGEEYINQINNEGWFDFDIMVATPDMMAQVGKLGRILGPRGLMPNPKTGTVTFDVAKAVADIKAGKVEYRADKQGNIHAPIGKVSFDDDKLKENFATMVDTVIKAKPATSKGQYLRNISIAATMGPGIHVNRSHYSL